MKLLLPLSLLCALSMLNSCASPTNSERQIPTVATDPKAACLAWRPVLYSRLHDTEDTIRQVKEQNAAHDAFCGTPR